MSIHVQSGLLFLVVLQVAVISARAETVGYWRFEETSGRTAFDASGLGNTGTLAGNPTFSSQTPPSPLFAPGVLSTRSLALDGSDAVIVADSPSLRPASAITLEAWIKLSGNPGNPAIIGRRYDDSGPSNSYQLGVRPDLFFGLNLETGESAVINTGFVPRPNRWYHVAGTWDGNLLRAFVDGVQIGSLSYTGQIGYATSNPVLIGADDDGQGVPGCCFFPGQIDEVRISDTALEPGQFLGPPVDFSQPLYWDPALGGNGHYYFLVASQTTSFDAARTGANHLSYLGMPGHLVTITSAAENNFVYEVFDRANIHAAWSGLTDSELFGGQESGTPSNSGDPYWAWVTGEPVSYTNWYPSTPNNLPHGPAGEDFVEFLFRGNVGLWNDIPGTYSDGNLRYYIVEFGGGQHDIRAPQPIAGDAEGDGSVGTADYAIWAAEFGKSGIVLRSDFNHDGSVGAADYAIWAAGFGSAGASPVPEPATGWLGLTSLMGAGCFRRRGMSSRRRRGPAA